MLYIGLVVALLAAALLEVAFVQRGHGSWSLALRSTMWLAALAVLAIAFVAGEPWWRYTGILSMSWGDFGYVMLAVLAAWIAMGIHMAVANTLSKCKPKRSSAPRSASQTVPRKLAVQLHILRMPFGHRCFILLTAAVTEEIFFRAYAIGVGQHLLGGIYVAVAVSVVVFSLGHYTWGLSHVTAVVLLSIIMSLLFVITRSLWACVILHAILDGPCFLAKPEYVLRHSGLHAQPDG